MVQVDVVILTHMILPCTIEILHYLTHTSNTIHTTVYLQITQVTSTETRKLREEYTPSKNKHSNYIYARNKTK